MFQVLKPVGQSCTPKLGSVRNRSWEHRNFESVAAGERSLLPLTLTPNLGLQSSSPKEPTLRSTRARTQGSRVLTSPSTQAPKHATRGRSCPRRRRTVASRIIGIASNNDGLFLARTLRKRKILKPGLASVPTALALLVQQYVTITETTDLGTSSHLKASNDCALLTITSIIRWDMALDQGGRHPHLMSPSN
ncbi:hypothetical protein MGU_05843 [Metarhizium guizhouense ARSEF 977]|uniref:Uncharacterized protein n=1 Tax=Metarhizium guizhouense (strain ARSEF 977) TaxID=1276136 RepID=A0A0B4GJ49_METGA|nr:hypothetical protein MGU_05843 [Metarhizium guizhouense ARSEF 977]